MKKRKITLPFLVLTSFVLVAVFGTVVAYMFRKTEAKDNRFTPAVVECAVAEVFDGTTKTSVTVKNTGNVDAYLRVRLVTYWMGGEGNIAPKPSETISLTLPDGWLAASDNTYYYTSPVAPDQFTANLLSLSTIELKHDGDYRQVVEVFAEAIQSDPEKAAKDSWGVTVDSNGSIVAVS